MYDSKPYFYGTAEENILLPVFAYMPMAPDLSKSTVGISMITLAWRP